MNDAISGNAMQCGSRLEFLEFFETDCVIQLQPEPLSSLSEGRREFYEHSLVVREVLHDAKGDIDLCESCIVLYLNIPER
jgi:hypothetical protein